MQKPCSVILIPVLTRHAAQLKVEYELCRRSEIISVAEFTNVFVHAIRLTNR